MARRNVLVIALGLSGAFLAVVIAMEWRTRSRMRSEIELLEEAWGKGREGYVASLFGEADTSGDLHKAWRVEDYLPVPDEGGQLARGLAWERWSRRIELGRDLDRGSGYRCIILWVEREGFLVERGVIAKGVQGSEYDWVRYLREAFDETEPSVSVVEK